MKAIAQDRYGSPDALELREVDKPVPAGNQVLVRVEAVSLNAYDWHHLRGDPYLARLTFGVRRPKQRVLGRDFAGRVEAVGADVKRLRPGDDVFGEAEGAFAEYVCAPEDVVETKPAGLTFEQAAALPLAGNTALVGLRDVAPLRPGLRVLVNGASGGVGTFAVQIAKAYGAEVTGVCSARNADLVRSLGADRVIDYAAVDFTREGRRYDVVFDLVGNRSLTAFRRALTPTGTLVLSGGGVSEGGSLFGPMGLLLRGPALSRFVGHRILTFSATQSGENLATLRELVESGKVAPVVDRTYASLAEVPEAIRYLEVEHARAKVVVTV
ncbi:MULTISPECIES: NAD(P)-dependent alcohol dehydrogenase [unclassified Streptomyces]|uniref:NAD(P)-dependent alcohol dehydrogenase n=1 Tax=unclassified Streptomyces TaxID=2593676 RepID=UPI0022507510|nr:MULTISPECIES: NAD(P)-dependent alcohol dehydrogenase [unclassified Streptomyces]MCX4988331.1 NAD(P)-dependent alcohol dehydrogenase [Streptomyces sp. NBC_00568]MCX5006464.1 NAD(P)-dependent alcohol dehydrogenase [Streptomyces sp. NBC_00638]